MCRKIAISFFLFLFCLPSFSIIDKNKNLPTIYYSYSNENFGEFSVYVKIEKNVYVQFKIVHEVVIKQYKNLWRLKDSYLCEFDNNEMKKKLTVLTAGENEFVWFSDRPEVAEATGGFHGNERIDISSNSFIKFCADNKELELNKDIPLTAASSFFYIQNSTMHQTGPGGLIYSSNYKPVEGYPIECYHEKKTIFKNKGFVTKNKLVWAEEVPVDRVYYGIFCVTKDISKYGYNDDKRKKPNIIEFNEDGHFKLKSENPRVIMFNKEKNIKVICDSKIIKGGPFELNTTIRDHDFYHKYYSAIDNRKPIITSKGEVWETEAQISFILEKD